MTDSFKSTLAWLLIGTIGVFMAMNWASASFTGVDYLPAGNDSFYHARRILDTWADPSAFYEFDPRIHTPEGSWIVWPWLYDYLMARTLRILTWITGRSDPMPILVYMPVFWAYVTVGLVLAIGAQLRLSWPFRILAGLVAALLPLNQALHGVGRIDHHYMEYTFVLGTLLSGLMWFRRPANLGAAALLGYLLGIAPGFHNGLFILQVPVILALFLSWLRREYVTRSGGICFGIFLMLGTGIVAIPSMPFQMGRFEFYLLSWFHVYIAACTAYAVVVISWRDFTMQRLVFLVTSGLVLIIPILGKLNLAGAFLSRRVERLNDIIEATSPYVLMKVQGFLTIGGMYSLLIYVVPIIFLGCLWALWRARSREQTFFYTTCLFGMVMMSFQFRLYYFGSVALYLPWMIWSSQWARDNRKRLRIASVVAFVICSIALFPSFRGRLFLNLPVGLDPHYQMAGPMMPLMEELCKENPGTVLAFNDAGHYLRFHTECSVIANNFLLTEQQQDKVRELDELLAMSVDDALAARPDIKYILAYYPKIYAIQPDGSQQFGTKVDLVYMNQKWPLLLDLLQPDDPESINPRLKIRKQFAFQSDELGSLVVGRVFEVVPPPSPEQDDSHVQN